MRPSVVTPLDPDSPAGIAATVALGDALAQIEVAVHARRRTAALAKLQAVDSRPVESQKAA